MHSPVKLAGHPVHPLLVAFPIAFYAAALACYAVYAAGADAVLFRAGCLANLAGVITALAASAPGFIDFACGIPRRTPARVTAMVHMSFNLGALALFVVNFLLARGQADLARPAVGLSVALPAAGMALTLAAGFLGWRLVQRHPAGVDLSPERPRLEPRGEPQS